MHDQLSGLWSKYRVLACKIQATFHAGSANNGLTCYIRGADDEAAVTTTTSSYLKESKNALAWREMRPCGSYVGGDIPQIRLRAYMNMRRFQFNVDENSYMAAFGANPSDSVLCVVGQCTDGIDSNTVACHVTLTYYVELRGRVLQAQS